MAGSRLIFATLVSEDHITVITPVYEQVDPLRPSPSPLPHGNGNQGKGAPGPMVYDVELLGVNR